MVAHYITDYRKLVADLKASYPLDQAMSLAVGGSFEETGPRIVRILHYVGLRSGMNVLYIGCGSGRVAKPISQAVDVQYLGIDVVPDLIAYASSACPPNYRFVISEDLTIPAPSASIDFAFATSVFTHLHLEETFLYLQEARRVLVPGGILVFSFLEIGFKQHRRLFLKLAEARRRVETPHLNTFLERVQIEAFATMLDFEVQRYIAGDEATPGNEILGQSVAVLKAA